MQTRSVALGAVLILQTHRVGCSIGDDLPFTLGQRPHLLRRAAHVQVAAAQPLVRRHQTAGAKNHLVLDHRPVHDDAAHADQHPATYSASVQQYLVADGHIIADDQGVAVGVEGPGVGNVQHAAILHAGTGTDADTVHVPPDHRHGPDRTVLAQLRSDDAAHADQHPATYSASVQQYLVADGHIIADDQGVAVGVEGPGVGNVQHAAILHAGTGTDADTVHVPPDHRHGPDRTVLAQL